MRRMKSLTAAGFSLAIVLGSSSLAEADESRAAAYTCNSGNFCIYSDWNGGGERCEFPDAQRANTADNCGFIQRQINVRSVWNGKNNRVQYYTQTNYNSRVGSTPGGQGGNLMGNYQIRSFKKQ
ncbi:peptidase inhibitor family I36 protein [Streptomyces sp. NPDC097617]|uniref:peptidase inhibitor family I36 protein n=1 Tax=Streptomyces sp. NPDC097617 TaxID=3366091 RepID=UPI0037F7A040